MHYLYHIRRKGMPLSAGYIGVTTNPTHRFRTHLSHTRNKHQHNRNRALYEAMRDYPDIEFVVIDSGDEDYIFSREKELRPECEIGWNKTPGGFHGGCIWVGKKRPEHSEWCKQNGFQVGNDGDSKPVLAAGFIFPSIKHAFIALGVNRKTIFNRIRRGNEGYAYIRDEE